MSSSLKSESFTVQRLHTIIATEMSHLAELAEVSVRTIHFHVEKDGSKSLGARASGNAFAVMCEAMRTGSGRKTLSIDMVNSWLIPTSNKGQVRFSQSVRSTPQVVKACKKARRADREEDFSEEELQEADSSEEEVLISSDDADCDNNDSAASSDGDWD